MSDELQRAKHNMNQSEDDKQDQQNDQNMYLKYDLRTKIMEEEEKKRKDPNRDFVITSGMDFLSSMKFFNNQIDTKIIGDTLVGTEA